MLLDAHAHIDEYGENLDAALDQIRTNQIFTLAVSMNPDSYRRTCDIANSCDFIIPSFGIHPWRASKFYDKLDQFTSVAEQSPMIGEIGLDHRFVDDLSSFPHQNKVFDYFLDVASKHEKIINLHTSGAEREVVEKLEKFRIPRSIVHWYNGPLELIDRYLSAGAWFTIGVELLFSNGISTILDAIPNDRLLTETDNPGGYKWLCGEAGQPDLIKKVISKIAQHKGMGEAELNALISSNFRTLIEYDPDISTMYHI